MRELVPIQTLYLSSLSHAVGLSKFSVGSGLRAPGPGPGPRAGAPGQSFHLRGRSHLVAAQAHFGASCWSRSKFHSAFEAVM